MVKVQPIHATGEVEGTDERALVGEQRAVHKVRRCAMLYDEISNTMEAQLLCANLPDGGKLQTAAAEYPHDTAIPSGFDRIPPGLANTMSEELHNDTHWCTYLLT